MRAFCLAVLGLCAVLLSPPAASAASYFLLNAGHGGEVDATSIGLELGGTRALFDRAALAVEVTLSDTDENGGSAHEYDEGDALLRDAIGAGVWGPYSVRWYNDGPELSALVKTGLPLGDVTLMAGGGGAWQNRAKVAESATTGFRYEIDEEVKGYWVGYLGVLWTPFEKLALSAGYDSRRGAVVGAGWCW